MIRLIIFFVSFNIIFASEPVIKSLHYFVNNRFSRLPVLIINSSSNLTIEFDIEAESEPNFNINFKFCDANWQPYDNLLLKGIGESVEYNLDIERLPITTEGAQYFVSKKFPTHNVQFNNSGKWMFYITDSFDEDIVYDYGKFYVAENIVKLNSSIQNWRREGRVSSNNANDRVLNMKFNFNLPDSLIPFRVEHIELVKNLEVEYPIKLEKDAFAENRIYKWNGSNKFEFGLRDFQPGNEYRSTNLNDYNKYKYPITRAQFNGIEYSRFYKLGAKDINGGFRLMDKKNYYSDYLIATFEFKPPAFINEDIFIVGSFTNWEVLPWFKMNKESDLYSISIELKRGVYNYQYVTGIIENEFVKEIDWQIFEGNFWETENLYSIFLYYKSPEKGEYDKIIGFKQIVR